MLFHVKGIFLVKVGKVLVLRVFGNIVFFGEERTHPAYMHRNTVINKLNKIVELTGVDLTDGGLCQRLTFSCQMIQYYERVMGMNMNL